MKKTLGYLVTTRDEEGVRIGTEFICAETAERAAKSSAIADSDSRVKRADTESIDFDTSDNVDTALLKIWPIIQAANEASDCDAFGHFLEKLLRAATTTPARTCATCQKPRD